MTRCDMEGTIHIIHSLMGNDEIYAIWVILDDVAHENKELALTLLRSSFKMRDQYQDAWDGQLEYAKSLFGSEAESALVGLL